MKKIILLSILLSTTFFQCKQRVEPEMKLENTLKSVSFYYDSIGIDPQVLFMYCDRVNKIIDSIGYPDAGYKLWQVQSDTNKSYRFLIEGYWPDQAIYDTIHNNKLYKNFKPAMKAEEDLWKALKSVSYNRFTIVK